MDPGSELRGMGFAVRLRLEIRASALGFRVLGFRGLGF